MISFRQFLTESVIKTADEIYDYVRSIHPRYEDWEEGDLEKRIYKYKRYDLKEVLVDDIDVAYNVNDDFVADLALEIENGKKINPVVLHQELSYYDVIDGCHRVEAYKDEGKKYITTYVAIQSKRK